jgi:hypothetical protein
MMNSRSIVAATALATTVGLTLSACGGGSSGLTRTALATKADAICKSVNAKLDAIPAPSESGIQDAPTAAAYFDKLLPIVTSAQSQVEALKPDGDAKADWDAFVAAEAASTNLLKTVDAKAHAADRTGLTDLQTDGPKTDAAVNAAAQKIGATSCDDSNS